MVFSAGTPPVSPKQNRPFSDFSRRTPFLWHLPLLFLVSAHLEAATTQQRIDNQQQLESQKRIYQQLQQQRQQKLTPFQQPEKAKPTGPAAGNCFPIDTIDVVGVTLLSSQKVDAVTQKYIGRCNYIQDLVTLTDELTALYIDKGYITSMAYLKEQDISDRQVEISIVEGRIEKIGDERPGLNAVFFGLKGKHLNLRDLEVAIDRINRLPSYNAKVNLLPGTEEGWSLIDVPIQRQKPWRVTLSDNNFGDGSTGNNQATLSLQYDNPLGLFDQVTVQTTGTLPHWELTNTDSQAFSYSIPFGRLLLSYSYSDSWYRQLIAVGATELESKGRSKSYDYNLDYRLFHNARHRVSVGAFINRYKTKNYLDDILLEASSYNLSKAGLSLSHLYQSGNFSESLTLTYIQGLDAFGAHHDTELDEQYDAWQLDATLVKGTSSLIFSSVLHAQYADKPQFSANRISVGGPYSVRGFNDQELNGNTGAYLRNELAIPVARYGNDSLQLYLGLDAGWVEKREDTFGGTIVGGAIGLRAKLAGLNLDLFYSAPLSKEDAPDNSDFAGFSLSYQY